MKQATLAAIHRAVAEYETPDLDEHIAAMGLAPTEWKVKAVHWAGEPNRAGLLQRMNRDTSIFHEWFCRYNNGARVAFLPAEAKEAVRAFFSTRKRQSSKEVRHLNPATHPRGEDYLRYLDECKARKAEKDAVKAEVRARRSANARARDERIAAAAARRTESLVVAVGADFYVSSPVARRVVETPGCPRGLEQIRAWLRLPGNEALREEIARDAHRVLTLSAGHADPYDLDSISV